MSIPIGQQIIFLREVVIPSFGVPPPYPITQSRLDWIRERFQNQYSNIFGSIIDELLLLFNNLHTEDKAESKLTQLLQEQTIALLQQQQSSLQTELISGFNTICSKLDENMNNQNSKLDNLAGMIEKDQSQKNASELNQTDLAAFDAIFQRSASQIIRNLDPNPDPKYQLVENKVRELAEEVVTLYSIYGENADEVKKIQPLTFKFFRETCEIYFPEFWQNKQMNLSNTATIFTALISGNTKRLDVKGKADSILYYNNVQVGSWEDKKFNTTLTDSRIIGQALSEVYGVSSHISSVISRQPLECTGILTNGLEWSLVLKIYTLEEAKCTNQSTVPITLTDGINLPTPENLHNVTLLILYHLQSIQNNIDLIDKYDNQPHKRKLDSIDEDKEEDDEDKEDDDDEDKEDDDNYQPSRKKPTVISRTSLQTKSNQSSKISTRGRGGGNRGSKTKKSTIQNQKSKSKSKSMLTFENVYRFNLCHPRFR